VIGALRQLAERPIAEGERRAAFFIAAAVVLAAATLMLIGGSGSLPSATTPPTPAVPPAAAPPPTAQRSEPEAAAVRFLGGYLPFLYGQGAAKSIRAAMPQLVERLVHSRVRVPPAARSRQPRLEAIGGPGRGGSRALVKARVGDGAISYTLALSLVRTSGRWFVRSVGAE
jgi:hypothetical protein